MSIKALERHFAPLLPFIQESAVTEICINQPQEIYVEKQGKFVCHQVEELTYSFLETLAALIAEFNHKDFPSPLLSGSLPTGERIQFVMNPACEKKTLICSLLHLIDLYSPTLTELPTFAVILGAFAELERFAVAQLQDSIAVPV